MADKIINLRINVEKINKAWLYKGEKGTYLDVTCFYNEKQDDKGQNGMIVQSVPADIYKKEVAAKLPKDQMSRGEILGNAVNWATRANKEGQPGYRGEDEKPTAAAAAEVEDDLPF